MTRLNFPRSVRAAAIKRATRDNGQIYCERCGLPVKTLRVDHIIAAGYGGKATLENAQVLGPCCYVQKDAADNAGVKRAGKLEAAHLGAPDRDYRPTRKIEGRGFDKRPKAPKPVSGKIVRRRDIFTKKPV